LLYRQARNKPSAGPAVIYRIVFKLVLQRIPEGVAHGLASVTLRAVTASAAARRLLRRLAFPRGEELSVHALGQTFPSPLGAGAGLDKDVNCFEALGAIGFGFVEVGTITAERQPGNPPPTMRRLPRDRAILNRMGFPNPGAIEAANRLRHRTGETIVGTNIGKSMVTPLSRIAEDYRATVRAVAPLSEYIAINVSSPNTPGLRGMQATEALRSLVDEVRRELREMEIRIPLLVKISPDLSSEELDSIADLSLEMELDGIVAVNTTVSRAGLNDADRAKWFDGGGISGAPLRSRALEVLQHLYARVADRLVLISIGGIESADDAWERIAAGATLIQAHTGFIYGGPGWPRHVNRALVRRVREQGFSSIQQVVGSAVHGGEAGPSNNGHGLREPAASTSTLTGTP
jgi:dihydroorotate dehydrogenase